ncbi:formimidoylglutamate deiminase [Afifella pfennigii]|uniref:formimidoylglutamate deiminase n=1 Tax=Afifella pfennigii TaxID=209897 RepID=UPI00047A2CFE|nr:formimidoylglutamate deiminase [Afifella pfennigii]
MGKLRFAAALTPQGWVENVTVETAADGTIAALATSGESGRYDGIALAGMPNLHSHAFQRGMAGLAERRGTAEDSFWTWREVMYAFLHRLTPEDVEAIAAEAYVEMLETGFTALGEFHYLHHAPAGAAYADPAEMAGRVVAAARTAGIGLTLLPVFYAHGGFAGAPLGPAQLRFGSDPEGYAALLQAARPHLADLPEARLGIAPHSLRAVTPETLAEVLPLAAGGPVHIHAAEQEKEVADCLAALGARPVEWLLNNAPVGPGWCLVHATHMTEAETKALARSGAVAGLCPVTEANLGDGLFPAPDFLGAGGAFGIGSDSNVLIDAAEELRLLEYGQRLRHRRRNVLGTPDRSTGRHLYERACLGGAAALGRPVGALAPGRRADILVLDEEHAALAGKKGDALLDSFLFAGGRKAVRDVYVGGDRLVEAGRHRRRDEVAARFGATMKRLLA